jgi:hypothetical protein
VLFKFAFSDLKAKFKLTILNRSGTIVKLKGFANSKDCETERKYKFWLYASPALTPDLIRVLLFSVKYFTHLYDFLCHDSSLNAAKKERIHSLGLTYVTDCHLMV